MRGLLDMVFRECEGSMADQALALTTEHRMKMIRFSDNLVSVSKSWNTVNILVYLIVDGRRAACLLDDLREETVRRTVRSIIASSRRGRREGVSPDLPNGPFEYGVLKGCYDERFWGVEEGAVEAVKSAVDSALETGAEKVSGTFLASESRRLLRSTEGCEGEEETTCFEFTVRAFADGEASGHANWCEARLDGFDPGGVGRTAGEMAARSGGARAGRAGRYDLVLSPSVMGNLLSVVGEAASAYMIDVGMSFLGGRLNQRVASEALTLADDPRVEGSPGGRLFDDEGSPTGVAVILEEGVLKRILHSSYTAKKAGVEGGGGNAYFDGSVGDMVPAPVSLVVEPGNFGDEELIQEVRDGLYVSNTWYTRFQNYRDGIFSTIPRDGVFRIRGGELADPVKGVRVSGDMEGFLRRIRGVSRDRRWARWWEVEIPVLLPSFWVEDVRISQSTK